jgi:GntR family transcriptional regulator
VQLRLEFRDREPIYHQIVDQVKKLVASGSLKPGDQLPTVREVAADLRINFNTAARAYRMLHEEGVISTQQGRGTYVLEGRPPVEARRARREQLQGMIAGWLEDASRYGFEPDEVDRAWREQFDRWVKK